jgi:hypothetical protein
MIDLHEPHPDERRPSRALHHPAARHKGQRKLRRWTAIGALGVAGLTAATAGLAYKASADQDAAHTAQVNAQKQRILGEYHRRQAIQDKNLAIVRTEQRTLARTLARERALIVTRRRQRQQQLAAIQVAQAAAAAQAARAPVYASARPARTPAQTTAQKRPTTAPRNSDGSPTTASGGS